jgi:hypothetical protein
MTRGLAAQSTVSQDSPSKKRAFLGVQALDAGVAPVGSFRA